MKIYFISGLGSSCSVFDEFTINPEYEKVYLEWKMPNKQESLADYVERMAEDIDTNEEFVLVGLSFGGIIAQEIAKKYPPKKLILISTIKSRKEMPGYFGFSRITNLHKLIPCQFFTSDRVISYAFFRKLYSKRLPDIQKYFIFRDNQYLRWSFHQIVNWKGSDDSNLNPYHLHGGKDPIFPIKKIQNPIVIENGNHIMILTKAKQISEKINSILEKDIVNKKSALLEKNPF